MLKKGLTTHRSLCTADYPRSCNTHVDSRDAERTP
jgi:hypothetical protein